jgi:hypothetical protein
MTETCRDLTVAEAAELIGLSRNHLDQIIHVIGPMAELVSYKDDNRRYFSRRDCAVLKIARIFERFGMTWLFAIADALEVVDANTQPDEHVILTCNRTMPHVRRKIADRDIERLQIEEATLLVPAGRIVATINAA